LLEEAIAINRNAIDLYRFTRQLNEILTMLTEVTSFK
jgi:hypothetical protein